MAVIMMRRIKFDVSERWIRRIRRIRLGDGQGIKKVDIWDVDVL